MDINKHPILEQHHSVCMLVEALPASEDQTKVSIALSELGEKIDALITNQDREIERLRELLEAIAVLTSDCSKDAYDMAELALTGREDERCG